MTQFTTDRRTIVKGAAWAVPAVSVAAAAPTLAASPTCETTYQTVEKTFVYSALGIADITVAVTARNVPMVTYPGADLLPIETTSTVTIPANIAGLLRSLYLGNADQVSGTSTSASDLTGVITKTQTTNLTIPMTDFPESGALVTVASGNGDAESVDADTAPGAVTITMGSPVSQLVGYDADGNENGSEYESTLDKKDGNDYVLGTFTVEEC